MTNDEAPAEETPGAEKLPEQAHNERTAARAPLGTEIASNGGEPIDVAGNWVGRVFGTNVGNASVQFEQDGTALTGEARFMDEVIGPTAYSLIGDASSRVEATLTPTVVPDGVDARPVTIVLELAMDGRLHGEWSSELGTGGVLSLERFVMPSQLNAGLPEQAATAPARIYNANRDVGAVRLGRDDLASLVAVVQNDFMVGRAVVSYTPKGGSQRTEYASTLLADGSLSDSLESLILNVQEAEPNNINRGVTVELASENGSSVRTYGSVESWVVGKAATVAAEIARHEKALVTGWKRWGLDFNGVIFLFALAFLPDGNGWLRLGYLLGALAILLLLRYVHARAIPMTVIQLGPVRPGLWSRIGAPAFSWVLAIGSAVAIKILSDVLSGSPLVKLIADWLSRLFGIEATSLE